MQTKYVKLLAKSIFSVSNLPSTVTEAHIWALFGPYGAVTSVSIVPEVGTLNPDMPTMVATVSMPIYDDAMRAFFGLRQNEALVSTCQLFG